MTHFAKKAFNILMATFVVYAILVATHKGEFWPFSIYPMFSQAGNPWTRAIVRDMSDTPDSLRWQTTNLENIHGSSVALQQVGIDQIDFSNFISKTTVWDKQRKQALLKMFDASSKRPSNLMIFKVQGQLSKNDSVNINAVPFLIVTGDSVFTNPHLPPQMYKPADR